MKKKILYTILFCSLLTNAQNSNSVLASGHWYKFSIDTTGVYKIDAAFLRELGLNTSTLNPRMIRIYGNGGQLLPELVSASRINDLQENSIFVEGEEDGVFNNSDYILFYAKGPHSWKIDPASNSVNHVQNIYSDQAYYFLTVDQGLGKRIATKNAVVGPATNTVSAFDDYYFYEKEEVNILAVGQQWFGERFNVINNRSFSFPFPNALPNSRLRIKTAAVGQSTISSSMSIQANGSALNSILFPPVSTSSNALLVASGESTGSINAANTVTITLNFNNNGNPSAKAFLDYIEIFGKKQLLATDKQFSFRSFLAATSAGVSSFVIQNGASAFDIWDVTNPAAIERIDNLTTVSTNFTFNDYNGTLKEYVVLHSTDFYTPKNVSRSKIANQNIHALTNIEYLVITDDTLISEARRLANYHQNNSNLNTAVVLLSEIYNEYASGSKDIVAIRDFIKNLHDTASPSKTLKYVCFFGDSSYDFKDRIRGNNNIVPSYHAFQSFNLTSSFVTDDFFVMIDPTDGNMRDQDNIDIPSGRIPVSTVQEARAVVDKILSYYSDKSFGDWRNTITLVADDIDVPGDATLQRGLEQVADTIKKYKPVLNINKIYSDAFKQENSSGGERYPVVKTAITNTIEKGTLVFDYFGHGGEDGLASERILEIPQIQAFNNAHTLPLFITVTCEFSRFDNPLRNTAGEQLFLNTNGGAVSMITTTRDVFISTGESFNKILTKYVLDFNGSDDTIAMNLIKAKNDTRSNQRFFIYYFGDPAMTLAIPKPNIQITKLNGIDITQPIDTLKALSKITLEGRITNAASQILSNFNGTLSTTIFDKPINKQTLDNDNFGVVNTFDSQESKLFKGKASVQNGTFVFDFIVPKDIKIAYGKGKVSLYANTLNSDRSGANFDMIIGGIDENAPEDNTGPEIQAFMNDDSFIDGANTNTSPNLIVKLSDLSGINTSITAVDHDIVAIIDNNQANPIILNDYYETALDDFTNGKVTYQLRDLEVGLHTITIKAWDTYNNSSETTLTFMVVSDQDLQLTNVLNYPNPFVNYTEFWFNHNKPNEPLEVHVQVFTISGKLIKTISQVVQTTGGLSRSITWNGLDDFGNKLGKGVYVYKLTVNASTSNLSTEKYEKLVIL